MNDRIADVGAAVNPTPAPGQIWQSRIDHREYVIADVGGRSLTWVTGGWDHLIGLGNVYTCVGIETPHGRVMVGERRSYDSQLDFEVCHVVDAARLWISDGVEGWPEEAEVVAAWPLVPSPLAKAAERGVRSTMDRVREYATRENLKDVLPSMSWDWVESGGMQSASDVFSKAQKETMRAMSIALVGRDVTVTPAVYPAKIEATASFVNPDPRAEREARRRAIDNILAEDARRFPAFATARRRAIVAHVERCEGVNAPSYVPTVLEWIHSYERVRGGLSKPSAEAWRLAGTLFGWDLAGLYERARSLP